MAVALQLGSIVWVEIADANGVSKLCPAIVITPTDRISQSAPLDVVAITSRLPDSLPDDHVPLPWHAKGHPRAGLNRRSAAVCTWVSRVQSGNVREVAGITPGAVLVEILRRIASSLKPNQPEN